MLNYLFVIELRCALFLLLNETNKCKDGKKKIGKVHIT